MSRYEDEAQLSSSCSADGPGSAGEAGSADLHLVPEGFAADSRFDRAADSILKEEEELIFDPVQKSCQLTSFESPRNMRPGVLAQVIFPVKSFPAFNAAVLFVARMDDSVEAQLLLSLESLQAVAQIRPVWVVALLVSGQMVLALQSCIADLANKTSFHVLMANHVLVENFSVKFLKLHFRSWNSLKKLTFQDKQPDIPGKQTASTRPKQT